MDAAGTCCGALQTAGVLLWPPCVAPSTSPANIDTSQLNTQPATCCSTHSSTKNQPQMGPAAGSSHEPAAGGLARVV